MTSSKTLESPPTLAEPLVRPTAPTADFTDPKFFAPYWRGERYYEYMQRLHAILKPENYLEIGVATGNSLRTVTCPIIGIDPGFRISADILNNKPASHLFRCTSDYFFENFSPLSLFRAPISMAFLDGMHLFEYLLRDFYNTERFCNPNSVIILHDCLPCDIGMTRRVRSNLTEPTRKAGWWTGDVWKILPVLRKYRPWLKILPLDAGPTGLVLVSNLDPKDSSLRDNYKAIVDEAETWSLNNLGITAYISAQNVESTAAYQTKESLKARLAL